MLATTINCESTLPGLMYFMQSCDNLIALARWQMFGVEFYLNDIEKGCLIKLLDRYRPEENSGSCARATFSVRKAAEKYGVPTDIPVEALEHISDLTCMSCARKQGISVSSRSK